MSIREVQPRNETKTSRFISRLPNHGDIVRDIEVDINMDINLENIVEISIKTWKFVLELLELSSHHKSNTLALNSYQIYKSVVDMSCEDCKNLHCRRS